MINDQLLHFIKDESEKGFSKEEITKGLLSNSWSAQDIEEGFNAVKPGTNTTVPPTIKKHSKMRIASLIVIATVLICLIIVFFGKQGPNEGAIELGSGPANSATKISCSSDQIPLIANGETADSKRIDMDKDGIDELIVTYSREVSGWEGMPDTITRVSFFTCENNILKESYKINPGIVLGEISAEGHIGLAVNTYDDWSVFLKNGATFHKIIPEESRNVALKKYNMQFQSNNYRPLKVINNSVEEIIPGFTPNYPYTEGARPEIKIIYTVKDTTIVVTSISDSKVLEVNAREIRYPTNWLCEFNDGESIKPCGNNIPGSHMFEFTFYPTASKVSEDSIFLQSIYPGDNNCLSWIKQNSFLHEGCISYDGGKNYAVYSNSKKTSIVSAFHTFIDRNH